MDPALQQTLATVAYLVSAILFIFGVKRLSGVRTAAQGNRIAALGMLVGVVTTLLNHGDIHYAYIIGGLALGGLVGGFLAKKVAMTDMPELVAFFNGLGGAASALVALSVVFDWTGTNEGISLTDDPSIGPAGAISIAASVLIGALTLTGSLIAYGKLSGKVTGDPVLLPGRHVLNSLLGLGCIACGVWMATATGSPELAILVVTALSLALGVMLVIPIGGADMPVVVSLLNSYSGVAAAMTGFVLHNNLLIISGSLVGASGLILTRIMCKAMNRSLANVLFGGFGGEQTSGGGAGKNSGYTKVKECTSDEAAPILESAGSVIFVPGYGLAVAQAQHTIRELADLLQKRGADVKYAIHPVAGRMPGHMNVLLAEANVPYEQLVEMDDINPEFKNTDVAIVVGANDVVNPLARNDKESPIYGMPILDVDQVQTCFVIKRSLSAGFAGIDNPLFEADNSLMIFGDAKAVLEEMVKELKNA